MNRRDLLLVSASGLLSLPARALYDPVPVGEIARLQGEWRGTLTYNDYSRPGKLVMLPTRLFAALSSPSDLALHYVYDDGPGKIVYSYERLSVQPDGASMVLASGGATPSARSYAGVSAAVKDGVWSAAFERSSDKGRYRFTIEIGPQALLLKNEEIEGQNPPMLRNEYRLRRVGS